MNPDKALLKLDRAENLGNFPVSEIIEMYRSESQIYVKDFLFNLLRKKVWAVNSVERLLYLRDINVAEIVGLVEERVGELLEGNRKLNRTDLVSLYVNDLHPQICFEQIEREINTLDSPSALNSFDSLLDEQNVIHIFEESLNSRAKVIVEMNKYSLPALVDCFSNHDSRFAKLYFRRLQNEIDEYELELLDDLIFCHNWSMHLPEVRELIGKRLNELLIAGSMGSLTTARLEHILTILPVEADIARRAVTSELDRREYDSVEAKLKSMSPTEIKDALKAIRDLFAC